MKHSQISAVKRPTQIVAGGVSAANIRKEKAKCAAVAPGREGAAREKIARLRHLRLRQAAKLAQLDRHLASAARGFGAVLRLLVFLPGILSLVGKAQAGERLPTLVGGWQRGGPGFFLADAADSLPDPHSFGAVGWLVVGLVGIIGFLGMALAAINGVLALRSRILGEDRIKQPFMVKEADRWATHGDLAELRRDHEALELRVETHYSKIMEEGQKREERIQTAIKENGRADEQRITKLHERINVVAQMKAVVELIASRLNVKLGGGS